MASTYTTSNNEQNAVAEYVNGKHFGIQYINGNAVPFLINKEPDTDTITFNSIDGYTVFLDTALPHCCSSHCHIITKTLLWFFDLARCNNIAPVEISLTIDNSIVDSESHISKEQTLSVMQNDLVLGTVSVGW